MVALPSPPVRQRSSGQRGIALVMTLAILSLLVVLALSFALASISAQKSTELEEGVTRAGIDLENGLQLVYQQIGRDFAVEDDDENLFPATSTVKGGVVGASGGILDGQYMWYSQASGGADPSQDGLDAAMHVAFGGIDFIPPDITSVLPQISWINVVNPDTKDRLSGRYAFLIIDESGKIDPSSAVSSTTAEGSEGNRLGLSPSEINLLDALDDSGIARYLQFDNQPDGALPVGLRWLSYYHILNSSDSMFRDDPARAKEVYTTLFPHSYDIEAYHDSVVDKHRFNLNQSQAAWDAMTLATIDTGAVSYWNGNVVAPDDGGIPWLHYGDAAIKNQVIANLIDYCDSNSIPHSDYDPSAPTDPPTASYVGLEKVPFINELLVTGYIDEIAAAPGTYRFHLAIQPELVNIYRSDYDLTDCRLDVGVTVIYQLNGATQPDATFRYLIDVSGPQFTDLTSAAHGYYTFENQAAVQNLDLNAYDEITISEIYVDHMALLDSAGNMLDYVATTSRGPGTRIGFVSTNYQRLSVGVDDPRCNQLSSQWTWGDGWTTGAMGTLGSRNTSCQPSLFFDYDNDGFPDRDNEPNALEPWEVSTAYIRNAPMQSLWELGCVHRGGAWQTINLNRYDAAASAVSGMGVFSNGDANILDQVKMGDHVRETGRINLNTYSHNVLRSLFAGVRVSSNYDADIATDSSVTLAAADTMADAVIASNHVASGTTGIPYRRRSRLANVTELKQDWTMDTPGYFSTDAAMESVIGKVIGIASVRQNYFTIIVATQVIKDVGAVPVTGNEEITIRGVPAQLKRYDPGADRVLGQQRIMAILYRDALNNVYRLERYLYLD